MSLIGGTVEHNTWDWLGHDGLAAGEYAELQLVCECGAGGGLRRISAAATGVRHECAWAGAVRAWWERAATYSNVPGELVCDTVQPGNQGVLRAITGEGQADESGAMCGSTEVVAYGVGGGEERAGI